jgi:hypothetical protein
VLYYGAGQSYVDALRIFDHAANKPPLSARTGPFLCLTTPIERKGGIAARRQISTKELADYVVKRVEE